MNAVQIEQFLFWCMVFNLGLLTVSSLLVVTSRPFLCRMHGRLFGLSEEQVSVILYSFLGVYKIVAITFTLVPWLAFQMLSQT